MFSLKVTILIFCLAIFAAVTGCEDMQVIQPVITGGGGVVVADIVDNVFVPPANTVLSSSEALLAEYAALYGEDPVAAKPQTAAGFPGDRISVLPMKDREEVYAQLIAAVKIPFFAEAAEKVKEVVVREMTTLVFPGGSPKCDTLGIYPTKGVGLSDLEDIYFEEYPEMEKYFEGPLRLGHSTYWLRLEFYRLQLQYTDLDACNPGHREEFLSMFRMSVRVGYILGMDNPWN